MRLLSNHKWVFMILFLVIGGTSIAIILKKLELNDSEKRFRMLGSELKSLLKSDTGISQKVSDCANENLQEIFKLRDKWMNSFGIKTYSSTPIDCYLNMKKGIDQIREKLLSANIEISDKCYFGFEKYLRTGNLPLSESMRELDRQLQMVNAMLNALIQVEPKEFLFIKREAVQGEIESDADLFILPLYLRLNIHSIFYSNAFKISFIGNTQTLRSFLNEIDAMANPTFIRDLEIHRYVSDKGISDEAYSIFSVVLELLIIKEPMI